MHNFVRFEPGTPWKLHSQEDFISSWHHPFGDVASFHYFDKPPDLAAVPDLQGMDVLRQMYRDALSDHGGIVSVEPLTFHSVRSVETIFKVPQNPAGMTYVASVTIPFRDFSFVVKFQCPEIGITGLRDATLFAKLSTELAFNDDGVPRGWMKDPYLASSDGAAKYNLSDQAEYDADFPDHPLSRARRYLALLSACVRAEKNLAIVPQFGSSRKSIWKFWQS